jgi:thioredoxin reductase
MSNEPPLRIAILGAGPIGLEAALYARYLGYEVELFEQGQSVAAHVQQWGHVRLFSPFHKNATPLGIAAIETQDPSWQCPEASDRLLAKEYYLRYLQPLAETDLVNGCLRLNTKIVAIGRPGWLKGDGVGDSRRTSEPFRLLTRTLRDTAQGQAGAEGLAEADVVIDCTGTYGNHNWLGQGGIPAIGECQVFEQSQSGNAEGALGGGEIEGKQIGEGQIEYGLPDVLGNRKNQYAGKHVLVVGRGYSAATTVVQLAELAANQPGTRITWLTRKRREIEGKEEAGTSEPGGPQPRGPIGRIVEDRLAGRDRLAERANALALDTTGPVTWLSGQAVSAVRYDIRSSRWEVTLVAATMETPATIIEEKPSVAGASVAGSSVGGEIASLPFDQIVANIGYRPDQKIYSELQVHTCYATDGPMQLSAQLMAQEKVGLGAVDCLDGVSHGPENLLTSEPNFYLLGAKSYGRRSQFLLSIGFEQIRDLFALLGGREDLDIYATMRR